MWGYYNRQGKPLTFDDWSLLCNDPAYRRVADTTLSNGRWVSTIWRGVNSGMNGELDIFETLVFASDTAMSPQLDALRHATESGALLGHARMCQKWSRTEES